MIFSFVKVQFDRQKINGQVENGRTLLGVRTLQQIPHICFNIMIGATRIGDTSGLPKELHWDKNGEVQRGWSSKSELTILDSTDPYSDRSL